MASASRPASLLGLQPRRRLLRFSTLVWRGVALPPLIARLACSALLASRCPAVYSAGGSSYPAPRCGRGTRGSYLRSAPPTNNYFRGGASPCSVCGFTRGVFRFALVRFAHSGGLSCACPARLARALLPFLLDGAPIPLSAFCSVLGGCSGRSFKSFNKLGMGCPPIIFCFLTKMPP